ncbi:MAG: IspD/TarI family cytidylyltransferase [Thermoanaerobaculia bacterium]|nr:IspD/TarI family cytidylyltransferase [Thermoanaerobaculia bacterium]
MGADDFVALVPAAGTGERYGGELPKQFRVVSGRSVLRWSVERLLSGGVDRVVVAISSGQESRAREHLRGLPGIQVVTGAATRQDSVGRCLEAAEVAGSTVVAVHDAARAAVDPRDVQEVLRVGAEGAAVLGRRVTDTLKRIDGGRIGSTVDRSGLWCAETPQVFRAETLRQAHRLAGESAFVGTDEASLVEEFLDTEVRAVEARFPNPKMTWPGDETFLALLLERGRGS